MCTEKFFTQKFYLTGGTALSEFYLKHRISEDLDFFCENEEVNAIYNTIL
ncbi:MAG: nucleotidyl transferase AbiEii/AbiGii toxin family protein [Candidatus Hydrogenedentota bacterium]